MFLLKLLHFILGRLFSSNACTLKESQIISSAADWGCFINMVYTVGSVYRNRY